MTLNHESPLQYKIIALIENVFKDGLLQNSSRIPNIPKNSKFYQQFIGFKREEIGYKIFSNFRVRNGIPEGLRLTYLGNELLKRNFTPYEFNHETVPTPKIYLLFDQKMQWPYYFSKKKLVLYNQDDAAWYKINGHDLPSFLDIL